MKANKEDILAAFVFEILKWEFYAQGAYDLDNTSDSLCAEYEFMGSQSTCFLRENHMSCFRCSRGAGPAGNACYRMYAEWVFTEGAKERRLCARKILDEVIKLADDYLNTSGSGWKKYEYPRRNSHE